MLRPPPTPTLFPYTTLFRSRGRYRADRPERTTIRADIAEGLRFLRRSTLLRTLAIMVGVFNFASSAVFTVFVLYAVGRSEEHTSELQSQFHLVCRLLLEKKK